MKSRYKSRKPLTEEELVIIRDTSIPCGMASILLDLCKSEVIHYRNIYLYKEERKKASTKFRNKRKQKDLDRLGKAHSCYNFWSKADIDYILTSEDSDEEMAEKLHKTVGAIQMKRCRVLKQNREDR